ncbi:MAG: T9SS type A sorting domain-containing protein, partial [Chitinophagaceae bacterium]|nr:T9SS type A sorting domain-containing protein [Chitinophagaceae bacterium]
AMSGLFRPVATSTLTLHAYNNGCGSQNGTITLHLSKKYAYRSASRPPTGVSGNTITWNVSNLSIGNNATIYVYADAAIGTTLKVDDTICNTVAIAPVLNDVNLSNNTIYQCDRVRASFDPNDKGVFPSGDISPGTKLTYTINFENLGDDTAFNIYILDTLSDMLDAGSFQILHSSHAISHVMQDPPGGQKVVRFEFKNINLPYKNTPAFNKGFVQFSINAKSGLPPLTQINNRAGIYFDINPAVMTNSTENRVTPVAVSDIDVTAEYSLFPNPVKDILTVETEPNGFESLTLLNSMGQVVTKQQVTGRSSYINMMSLPAGLYYIQLIGREGVSTQKVEKL